MIMDTFYQQPILFLWFLLLLSLWTSIWKGFGLWFAAKNGQKGWFISLLIIDVVGLLPIIYLIWFKPKQPDPDAEEKMVGIRHTSAKKKTTLKKKVKKQ